jgi:hypothetical protein
MTVGVRAGSASRCHTAWSRSDSPVMMGCVIAPYAQLLRHFRRRVDSV